MCPSFAFGTDGARGSVSFGPYQGMVIFLCAIYQHTTDPLIDYDPTIPLREDEEIEGEEVDVVEEEEEELYGEEDDWFVYPHDLTYEDDQDDVDFVV